MPGDSLGVLYTGWLDKKNPVSGYYKKRFVVLTSEAIHWFKRETKSEKTGARTDFSLPPLLSMRILDEDPHVIEIYAFDKRVRFFKGESKSQVEEWVAAIDAADNARRDKLQSEHQNQARDDRSAVLVDLITVRRVEGKDRSLEFIKSRSPAFGTVIVLDRLKERDEVIISTTDGGMAIMSRRLIEDKLRSRSQDDIVLAIAGVDSDQSLLVAVARDNKVTPPWTSSSLMNALSFIWMVLSVGLVALSLVFFVDSSFNQVLLCVASFALGILSLCISIRRLKAFTNEMSYELIIKAHRYVSSEESSRSAVAIPERFISGCDGDLEEARHRWDITREWRRRERVDDILREPHPHFFEIREHFPHGPCGWGREGHLVMYERSGELDLEAMKTRGITLDVLFRHWLFMTEYLYGVLAPGEDSRGIVVIDVEKVRFSDLSGEKFEHAKRTIITANEHYPERGFCIFVVNAPPWSSFVWKLLKPFIDPKTQKKVKILSKKETLAGLQEHLDISQIPEYYGGQLDFGGPDSCRFKCPESLAMDAYVRDINNGGGLPFTCPSPKSSSGRPASTRQQDRDTPASIYTTPKSRKYQPEEDVWSVTSARTNTTLRGRRL